MFRVTESFRFKKWMDWEELRCKCTLIAMSKIMLNTHKTPLIVRKGSLVFGRALHAVRLAVTNADLCGERRNTQVDTKWDTIGLPVHDRQSTSRIIVFIRCTAIVFASHSLNTPHSTPFQLPEAAENHLKDIKIQSLYPVSANLIVNFRWFSSLKKLCGDLVSQLDKHSSAPFSSRFPFFCFGIQG